MPPDGEFTVEFAPGQARHYVAFAVGSGITPVYSLIKTALATEPDSRFTLFYGNRASSSVLFREALEDLKNRYMARFSLCHVMSRETQDVELFNGRLDGAKVAQLLTQWLRVRGHRLRFSVRAAGHDRGCGSHPGRSLGVPARASSSNCSARRARASRSAGTRAAPGQARVPRHRGAGRTPPQLHHRQEPRQRAGFRAGAGHRAAVLRVQGRRRVPPARCKVVEGEVDMDANFALEDYEVRPGLLC